MNCCKEKAICLLTIYPHKIWMDFFSTFHHYDIFIVIDDMKANIDELQETYPMIQFVKVSNEECEKSGYIHSSYMPSSSLQFNEIIAWDRALYFFTRIHIHSHYQHVWFFEEDVFFYNEQTLQSIDNIYPESDILCKEQHPEPKENEWNWFWAAISIHFPSPYFHSMISCIRMSKQLLFHIHEYVEQYKTLFFIEAMFPSIAYRNQLQYQICDELSTLYWRREWNQEEFTKKHIFHPIKHIEQHSLLRVSL